MADRIDNDNDKAPLADAAKESSLTEFEKKALGLKKEGRLDEIADEIARLDRKAEDSEAKGEVSVPLVEATPEQEATFKEVVASLEDVKPIFSLPAKQLKEVQDGFAYLNEIKNNPALYSSLKAQWEKADAYFKEKVKEDLIPKARLPKNLISEDAVLSETIGNADTVKIEEAPAVAPKSIDASKDVNKDKPNDKFTFVNDLGDNYSPPPASQEKIVYPEEPHVNTGSAAANNPLNLLDQCPHCGWNLRKEDHAEADMEDRRNFVQSILGNFRFKKKFSLFNNEYRVTFRALTSKECDMAFRQIVLDSQYDYKNNVAASTDFYWRNLQAYRLAMSLQCIDSDSYGSIDVPSLDEADIPGVSNDPLQIQSKMPPYLAYVLDSFLPLESTRAVIAHAYFEFQQICDKLQVMAESPNFWKAIE
jgi:hypothetical protein